MVRMTMIVGSSMLAGVFSVWFMELFLHSPMLCEAVQIFGLGLVLGGGGGYLMMLCLAAQVVNCCLTPPPRKARKTIISSMKPEAEPQVEEILPTFDDPPMAQEVDYGKDAWLHDPDYWKRNLDH